MTEEQLDLLRYLIKQEIDAAQIDGMEHGAWGWADKQLDEGWEDFKNSFKSTADVSGVDLKDHFGGTNKMVLRPIPVSERLPGPDDCDAEGKCWWGEPQIGDSHDATWNFCTQNDAEEFCTWGIKCGWLPANALPQPLSPINL